MNHRGRILTQSSRYYAAWRKCFDRFSHVLPLIPADHAQVLQGETSEAFISWYFSIAHELAHNLGNPLPAVKGRSGLMSQNRRTTPRMSSTSPASLRNISVASSLFYTRPTRTRLYHQWNLCLYVSCVKTVRV